MIKNLLIVLSLILITACNPLSKGKKNSSISSGYHPGTSESTDTSTPTPTTPPGPFILDIPFAATTDASYTISNSSVVDLTGGVARLTPSDQTDSDSTASGFGGGTYSGTQYDASNGYLRLNATTNNAELDSSWAPRWANLRGYWKLNEAAGAATTSDSSGYGNTGTIVGGVTSGAAGKLNNSFSFDGNLRYVNLGNPAMFQLNNGTISAWVKTGNAGTGYRGIVVKQSAYGVFFQNNQLILYDWGTSDRYTSLFLNDNNWQHILITFQSGVNNGTFIYVNGVLVMTTKITVINQATSLVIGDGGLGVWQTFIGNIDEVAIWNTPLTATEVSTIYSRQSAKYSGSFLSRVMDANSLLSWTSIQSLTTLPFMKELPASSETSGNYSSTTSNLMTGLVGLWHFNETSAGTAPGGKDFKDSSGNSNHLTKSGGVTFGDTGLMSGASSFSIATNGYAINSNIINIPYVTVSAWVYLTAYPTIQARVIGFTEGNGGGTHDKELYIDTTGKLGFYAFDWGVRYTPLSVNPIPLNQWTHIVGTADGANVTAYMNGVLVGQTAGGGGTYASYTGANLLIGGFNGFWGGYQKMLIDEAAIWSRALSSTEILEVYRRGANRIKYQIRTCTNADCSDQEVINPGKGWKGPDNTYGSYFSEVHNNTSINSSTNPIGTVNSTAMNLVFSSFASAGLSVSASRYFQYRTILESDDTNSLCNYGSGATACSPELQSFSASPVHYDVSNPTITSKASIGSTYVSLDVNGFIENLGGGSCTGVRYAISGDGVNFYYHNGSAWTLSSSTYATASSAASIASNISTLVATMGIGTLQIKTFLHSDGVTACEVDNLRVTGMK